MDITVPALALGSTVLFAFLTDRIMAGSYSASDPIYHGESRYPSLQSRDNSNIDYAARDFNAKAGIHVKQTQDRMYMSQLKKTNNIRELPNRGPRQVLVSKG
jgi:hypothetical protein